MQSEYSLFSASGSTFGDRRHRAPGQPGLCHRRPPHSGINVMMAICSEFFGEIVAKTAKNCYDLFCSVLSKTYFWPKFKIIKYHSAFQCV
jgi:hypothetical protein